MNLERHAYCDLSLSERKMFYLKSSQLVSIIKIESCFLQLYIIAKNLISK